VDIWFRRGNKQKDINSTREILEKRLVSGIVARKKYNSLLNLIKEV